MTTTGITWQDEGEDTLERRASVRRVSVKLLHQLCSTHFFSGPHRLLE